MEEDEEHSTCMRQSAQSIEEPVAKDKNASKSGKQRNQGHQKLHSLDLKQPLINPWINKQAEERGHKRGFSEGKKL